MPIGDQLAALDVSLLLAKHEGCLGRTDEGFEDIVAAFPQAMPVSCPEACTSIPAYAGAVRRLTEAKAGSVSRLSIRAGNGPLAIPLGP